MDRPPEDPTPQDPASDGEPEPVEAAPQQPPDPVSPYGPPAGEDGEDAAMPDAPGPPARPYEWAPPASAGQVPPEARPGMAYPPVPQPPSPVGPMPMGPPPGAQKSRPGIGAGVATGCGLQVLAFILFFVTAGLMLGFLGALWPFILVTVGSALLMLSQRWRRFATGALIVCAATWIIAIGPCIALLGGFGTV